MGSSRSPISNGFEPGADAEFGMPEAKWGFIPSQILPFVVGRIAMTPDDGYLMASV